LWDIDFSAEVISWNESLTDVHTFNWVVLFIHLVLHLQHLSKHLYFFRCRSLSYRAPMGRYSMWMLR